jgi:hypothetical protein
MVHRASVVAAIVMLIALIAGLLVLARGALREASGDRTSAYAWLSIIAVTGIAWCAVTACGFLLATFAHPRIGALDHGEHLLRSLFLPAISVLSAATALWVAAHVRGPAAQPSLLLCHALAMLAWLQAVLFDRWLDRIEERVDLAVLNHQPAWMQSDIWQTLVYLLRGRTSMWAGETWRFLAYVAAPLTVALYWYERWKGDDPRFIFLITLLAPLMLMLTMRRTVRAVRHERDAALESIESSAGPIGHRRAS